MTERRMPERTQVVCGDGVVRIYESVGDPERDAFFDARRRHDESAITNELLALTYHDPDWQWVQDQCLAMIMEEPDSDQCQFIAAMCLGHLWTFHGELDRNQAVPAVAALLNHPSRRVRAGAECFFDDYGGHEPVVDYWPVGEADRPGLEAALDRGPIKAIGSAIYALAWRDSDWRWVQNRCMELFEHPHPEVRRMAAVSLHQSISRCDHFDGTAVLPALRRLREELFLPRDLDRLASRIEMLAGVGDAYSVWVEPDREALMRAKDHGDISSFACHLVGLSIEDPDYRWVQGVSLRAISDHDDHVRRVAVTSLDNLLTLRGALDRDLVVPRLRALENDEPLRQVVRCFFSDLEDADESSESVPRLEGGVRSCQNLTGLSHREVLTSRPSRPPRTLRCAWLARGAGPAG